MNLTDSTRFSSFQLGSSRTSRPAGPNAFAEAAKIWENTSFESLKAEVEALEKAKIAFDVASEKNLYSNENFTEIDLRQHRYLIFSLLAQCEGLIVKAHFAGREERNERPLLIDLA